MCIYNVKKSEGITLTPLPYYMTNIHIVFTKKFNNDKSFPQPLHKFLQALILPLANESKFQVLVHVI